MQYRLFLFRLRIIKHLLSQCVAVFKKKKKLFDKNCFTLGDVCGGGVGDVKHGYFTCNAGNIKLR